MKINYGLILFVIICGLILLANLFEILTWQIWTTVSIILVGMVFFVNLLYKVLKKKKWAYKISQFLIIALTFSLLTHTVLGITKPGYLPNSFENSSTHEIYQKTMELKTDYHFGIERKEIDVLIEHELYNITDSPDNSYHFKIHPPKPSNTDVFVEHKKNINALEIKLESVDYKLHPLQEFFEQHPSLILGNTHLPANIQLNVKKGGNINIDLNEQRIDEFAALFENGFSNLKFSQKSFPKEKVRITVRGGVLTLFFPKELSHNINYIVNKEGEFFVGEQRILERGEYLIISDRENEKEKTDIKITVDTGKVILNTH